MSMMFGNNRREGSAVILAMLLLVLISAIGIYVISLPYPVSQDMRGYEREAVVKSMASAGVHAAIARFAQGGSDELPYVRYFDIGREITGKYTVSSRESGKTSRPGSSTDAWAKAKEYVVLSEGSIVQSGGVRHIVRATVQYLPKERKSRIVAWEESK